MLQQTNSLGPYNPFLPTLKQKLHETYQKTKNVCYKCKFNFASITRFFMLNVVKKSQNICTLLAITPPPPLKKLTCKGTLRQVFICLRPRTPYHLPPYTLYRWRYFALVSIVVISPWDEESQVCWPSLHTSLPKQFVLKKILYCTYCSAKNGNLQVRFFLSFSKLLTLNESGIETILNLWHILNLIIFC